MSYILEFLTSETYGLTWLMISSVFTSRFDRFFDSSYLGWLGCNSYNWFCTIYWSFLTSKTYRQLCWCRLHRAAL